MWNTSKGVIFVTFCWCDKIPWLRAPCGDFIGLQVHTEIYNSRPAWQPVSGGGRWQITLYHTGNWEQRECGVRPFAFKAHASDLLPSARLHMLNIPWLPLRASWTGEQVFRYVNPWGTFLIEILKRIRSRRPQRLPGHYILISFLLVTQQKWLRRPYCWRHPGLWLYVIEKSSWNCAGSFLFDRQLSCARRCREGSWKAKAASLILRVHSVKYNTNLQGKMCPLVQ